MEQPHNNQKLTVDELRSCLGCEHFSDTEALIIIETIYQLSLIIYQITVQQEEFTFDNQQFVYLKSKQETDNLENLDKAA